jgi:hypothetical protein
MMIVRNNNYFNFKKNPNPNTNPNKSQNDMGLFDNNEEIEFDLWPDINKTYVKGDNNTENTFMNEYSNINNFSKY